VFKKIQQGRIYEQIVNQVLEALLRGDLKPKDKLPSENELSLIFGVSRVTVREAIRSLEQLGVVEVRRGNTGGAYIKKVNMDELVQQIANALCIAGVTFQHLAEARELLEEMIISKLALFNLNSKHIQRLKKLNEMAKKHYKEGKNRERLLTNFKFHGAIAEITRNPLIVFMHKLISKLSIGFFENVVPSDGMIQNTLKYHDELINLLEKGDFVKASLLCSRHIKEVSADILAKSKQQISNKSLS